MADFFGVCEKTLNNWKDKNEQFLQSLKEGKKEADSRVVKSLFQRAVGYSCPDTKFATHEGIITDTKEFIKHYPPETTACIFWLKNRRPDEWKDTKEVETGQTLAELIGKIMKD